MVVSSAFSVASVSMRLLADSPISRLDPLARAKLLGGLILLSIGGIALIVLCWLALRVGRRALRREDLILKKFSSPANVDDWAAKPLVKPDQADSGDVHSDDDLG